jgi:hypothetical protein
MPRLAVPTLPVVLLVLLGLFMLIAMFGTLVPSFVTDRVPKQFIPVSTWFFGFFGADLSTPEGQERWAGPIKLKAHICQVIIAATEGLIAVTAFAAACMPRKRVQLTHFSVGLATGLFGAFMLTMFAIHSKDLPAWNQYPAIFAWLGITWLIVVTWEKGLTNAPKLA